MKLEVLPDAAALAAHAAGWMTARATAAQGAFAVALSGGSTPRLLYRLLAARDDFPWGSAQWYWGDERFVPPDDPASNYGMAREAMLFRAPAANIHPVSTEGVAPDEAAALYEDKLRRRGMQPLFDLVLLGLGSDGHTASLFPGSAALDERVLWVRATENGRITLTYPALNSSRKTVFLVSGAEKRGALERLLGGDTAIPAAHVEGDIAVFADRAAAG